MITAYFWFRRDLRLNDNKGLFEALKSNSNVQPIFIFDTNILDELENNDTRVNFIYENLQKINTELNSHQSSLQIFKGNPVDVWKNIIENNNINTVYTNKDYEPYAIKRDLEIKEFLKEKSIQFKSFKDQVIFEEKEILKDDLTPYTVFTPYKNKWLKKFSAENLSEFNPKNHFKNLSQIKHEFPQKKQLNIENSSIKVKAVQFEHLNQYDAIRDFPFKDQTSYLSPHLRFGTFSIREIVKIALNKNQTFLSELIWREFFMQILFHFPRIVNENFKTKYNGIEWRNNEEEFDLWCNGKTGYPLIDAGMRQLNKTGYMHNRVRMVTAGFLCKHLLIDWKWGEAYFAKKLLDYDLSANNGNWQWASGTGCDAAPYFRVFNPSEQIKKFDANFEYINQWVDDLNEFSYPKPIIEHKFARERAINTYKKGLI